MGGKLLDITEGSRLHEPPNIVNVCASGSERQSCWLLLPYAPPRHSPRPTPSRAAAHSAVLLKRST